MVEGCVLQEHRSAVSRTSKPQSRDHQHRARPVIMDRVNDRLGDWAVNAFAYNVTKTGEEMHTNHIQGEKKDKKKETARPPETLK